MRFYKHLLYSTIIDQEAKFRRMVKRYNQLNLAELVDYIYVEGFTKRKLEQAKRNLTELKSTDAAYSLLEQCLSVYEKGGILYEGDDRTRCSKKWYEAEEIKQIIKDCLEADLSSFYESYGESNIIEEAGF